MTALAEYIKRTYFTSVKDTALRFNFEALGVVIIFVQYFVSPPNFCCYFATA